ncbi:MAG TPA: hypothetical protein VIV58_08180 [Kofleriaceae bacterium]
MTRMFVIVSLLFASACDVGTVLANQGGGGDAGGSGSGSGGGSNCGNLVSPAPQAHTHIAGGTSNAGVACIAAGCHLDGQMGAGAPSYSYAGTVYTDAGGATPAAGSTMFFTAAGTTRKIVADAAGNFFVETALLAAPTNQATANTSATQCPTISPMVGSLVQGGGNCSATGSCHGGTQGKIHLP